MSKRLYTCVKCGGSVVPGQNGLLRGLSTEPDGYPSGEIKDSMQAIHYAKDCGAPDKEVPFPSLGPLDEEAPS